MWEFRARIRKKIFFEFLLGRNKYLVYSCHLKTRLSLLKDKLYRKFKFLQSSGEYEFKINSIKSGNVKRI